MIYQNIEALALLDLLGLIETLDYHDEFCTQDLKGLLL